MVIIIIRIIIMMMIIIVVMIVVVMLRVSRMEADLSAITSRAPQHLIANITCICMSAARS